MSSRIRKLIQNSGIFFLGNIASRMIIYILTPIYTAYLSESEYAKVDLLYTTIQIAIPLLTLRVASALFRMSMDNDGHRKNYLTNAVSLCVASLFPAIIISLCVDRLIHIDINPFLLVVCYFLITLNEILGSFLKSIDKNKIYATVSVLYSVVLLFSNYIMLKYLHFGMKGYFFSLCIAGFISCSSYYVIPKIWEYFNIKFIDINLMRKMLRYSIPLVPSALCFWVVQASDKYMVYGMISPVLAGLYSVAYKIPNITGAVVNIFSQAWEISAIENKDNDYYRTVYKCYYRLIILASGVMIVLSKQISAILFKNGFIEAERYVGPLILAYIMSYNQTFLEGILISKKDTKCIMISTVIGAVVNVVLNFLLISALEVDGAIIATGTSYLIVFFIRRVHLIKIGCLSRVGTLDIVIYILTILVLILYLSMNNSIWMRFGQAVILIILCAIFVNTIRGLRHENRISST